MNTDRELLELAAKAAGMEPDTRYPGCWYNDNGVAWSPLTDDGDAFRLAVKLLEAYEIGHIWSSVGGLKVGTESSFDSCAATRRAIVRAAAEIGKGMK